MKNSKKTTSSKPEGYFSARIDLALTKHEYKVETLKMVN
ncbi:hypothetical protein HNQ88_003038 [Aureibacter tunicatorum]|uniref:Uncharacterized protein n=1 Tax=Aureibacter tunicatorum TaxID=866807 RepID=A0AAE3XNZ4_9BACT|nr:hypothetical protein [Aureibacter tunicatorum]BDD04462.1 hypothetical protein AUTU_19450 [Aureibacter tunicatorum]